jgi:type III secretion protein V
MVELSVPLTQRIFPNGAGDMFSVVVPALRGDFFDEMGILLPGIRFRGENEDFAADEYRFLLSEAPIQRGSLPLDRLMIDATAERAGAEGITGEAAPLPEGGTGLWVTEAQADKARTAGFRVSSAKDVLIRRLVHFVRGFAHDFIGIEETQVLLDSLAKTHPHVVKEVVPRLVSLPALSDILKRLLEEGVSVRPFAQILGAMAEWAPLERDPVALTEHVRVALRRQIVNKHLGPNGTLAVFLLDPMIEESIREAIQRTATGSYLALDPSVAKQIVTAVGTAVAGRTERFVILTSAEIRRYVRRLIEGEHRRIPVFSYQELSAETKIQQLGRIKA